MNDCGDCQNKNNDGVDVTAAKKPTGDGLIITTVVTTTAVIFFGLRLVGMRQGNALLTSTSFGMVYVFTSMENLIKNLMQ